MALPPLSGSGLQVAVFQRVGHHIETANTRNVTDAMDIRHAQPRICQLVVQLVDTSFIMSGQHRLQLREVHHDESCSQALSIRRQDLAEGRCYCLNDRIVAECFLGIDNRTSSSLIAQIPEQ